MRLHLRVLPLPSISNSCPWEPTRVFERKGAKSTMISRKSGQTEPNAISNFCVSDASRDGVGTGRWSTSPLIGNSSGRGDAEVITNLSDTRTTEISPEGFSPRSALLSIPCSRTFPSLSWISPVSGGKITVLIFHSTFPFRSFLN